MREAHARRAAGEGQMRHAVAWSIFAACGLNATYTGWTLRSGPQADDGCEGSGQFGRSGTTI